ncbi:MAG: hypothetical protein HYV26_24285 [Candidatus Hydrogenedentes bacterium]|nr:hypothetical protein [Candidatus Hydrogenedentota bacterium]MBI3118446.1 hypothetical protein [Candidatus Hydrogenedentota bacterium]
MSSLRPQVDVWRIGATLLWMVFFILGLQPDKTFYALRMAGEVVTQRAFVNSQYAITYLLCAYIALTIYRACRAAGCSPVESHGKTLQLTLLALIAFYPFQFEQALDYQQIALPMDRYINLGFGILKCWAWLYLLSVVIRYEIIDGPAVFLRMFSIFPSARQAALHRRHVEQSASQAAAEIPPKNHAEDIPAP